MTLVNALESLKAKGIKKMVGFCVEAEIDRYIQNAKDCDQEARDILKSDPDIGWARYHIEHEDNHFIIEINGHYIIATTYESSLKPGTTFHSATYGTEYETEEQMKADFDEWSLMHDAEKIADEMIIERPGILARNGWLLIAINELQKSRKEAEAAFQKNYIIQ
jgi:hypothetical protein